MEVEAPDPEELAQRHQANFRKILEAMSRPGSVVAFTPAASLPGTGLHASCQSCLTGLVDFETPVWLEGELATPELAQALRFSCGCPIASTPMQAAFVVIGRPSAALPLHRFAAGTPEYPDRSATVLVQTEGFLGRPEVRLSGPGIEHEQRIGVAGADAAFWRAAAQNHVRFPLGVDWLFTSPAALLALPRSIRVEPL